MMIVEGYAQIIVFMLALSAVPAFVLTWVTRPKPFYNVFRGGEAALCLGWAVDSTRRLMLIGGGTPISFPPDVPMPVTAAMIPGAYVAIFNLCLMTVVSFLLWGRVSQNIRHKIRNRDTEKRFLDHLAKDDRT